MGAAKDCSPAAVAYAAALLARAAAVLDVPAAALVIRRSRGGGQQISSLVTMRAAIAHALRRAGISIAVLRRIALTARSDGLFRDTLYRPELVTPVMEGMLAAITHGLDYVPPAEAEPPAAATAADRDAADRLLAAAKRALGAGVLNTSVLRGEHQHSVRERALQRAAVFAEARTRGIAPPRLVEATGITLTTWHNAHRILDDPARQKELADLRAAIRRAEQRITEDALAAASGGTAPARTASPRGYDDDPLAVLADTTGKAPQVETWAPSPQEQG